MKTASVLLLAGSTAAFMAKPTTFRQSRHVVCITDHVAELIDQQYYRQGHHDEVEAFFQKRNAALLDEHLPEGFEFDDHVMEETLSPRALKKDKYLASKDPAAYCADRCIATGNCDVFEDVFKLSPEQVLDFCNDCVLSEGEEPCDVPYLKLLEGFGKLKP